MTDGGNNYWLAGSDPWKKMESGSSRPSHVLAMHWYLSTFASKPEFFDPTDHEGLLTNTPSETKLCENFYTILNEEIQVVHGKKTSTWKNDSAHWVNIGNLKNSQAPIASEKYELKGVEEGWEFLCQPLEPGCLNRCSELNSISYNPPPKHPYNYLPAHGWDYALAALQTPAC